MTDKNISDKKINLLFNISEIAIITGDNKFKTKRDFLIDFWKKNLENDYMEYKKLTEFTKETDLEKIENISKKYKLDIQKDLNKLDNISNISDLNIVKNSIIEKAKDKTNNLSENEKKEIIKSVENVSNTQFGTQNEGDVLTIYQNLTKNKIIKDDKYRKTKIYSGNNFNIYIGGKIDGINVDNGYIIEIKNRIHKLFYALRDYEKVQIICYMYLFGSENAHLVESFRSKNNTNINIIDVKYDEEYMENIILKLFNFCNYYINFIRNHDLKISIMKNSNEIDF
jgi:hypothetical protein